MSLHKIHIYLTPVLVLLGFLVAYSVQYNATEVNGMAISTDSDVEKKIKINEKINQEEKVNEDLQRKLQEIQLGVKEKEKKLAERQVVARQVANELETARMEAGLVPVHGEGVILTLQDSKKAREFANIADGIIHDQDIRDVINELFVAGAEGVAINDQRLVTTSAARCVGPTVIVNGTKLAPPFVFQAIGNKEEMVKTLSMPNGVLNNLKKRTLEVDIQKAGEVELPGYIEGTSIKS